MRIPDDWSRFVDGLPPDPPAPNMPPADEEPDLEDMGPLAEAMSMLDCFEDELDEAREHLNLAESVLADLRHLLDSGELHESGSDACKDGEE